MDIPMAINRFELSTRKSLQLFIFLFVYIMCYGTESVKGNVICTYNPCTFSPDLCINGGTCKSDAYCRAVCDCPSDFSGYRCETSNTNTCTKKCSPETCNRQGYCKQDSNTCNFACDCFNGFAGDTCNVNVPEKDETIGPCFPLVCVHGHCDKSKPNQVSCICQYKWKGLTCNIRKVCNHYLGMETCQ